MSTWVAIQWLKIPEKSTSQISFNMSELCVHRNNDPQDMSYEEIDDKTYEDEVIDVPQYFE